MSQNITLQEFLDNHKGDSLWTHTSLKNGKYFIPDEHKDQFYELYVESIRDQEKQYLTEKTSEIGPLRVDFDFIYGTEVKKHLHTPEQVSAFCLAYIQEVGKYLKLPNEVDLYIMEKRKPTLDSKKNRIKSGIHIVVPQVCTHKFVEQRVRRSLLDTMSQYFEGLPVTETWEKIYDAGVVDRSVPWTIYGSRKNDPNALPYLTSYILSYSDGSLTRNDNLPPVSTQLMKTLSLVRDDDAETPMTEEGQKIYAKLSKPEAQVRISGGRAVTPARGRPAGRNEKAGSRESSPNGRIVLQVLTPERKEYIKQHVMNLSYSESERERLKDNSEADIKARYEKYDEWVNVGICLHNIHPDLLDVFLDFSAQDKKSYNEAECINKWNGFTLRNDGDRIGEGTLRYWSRGDNEKEFKRIESENVDRLVIAACSGTEHDVAAVIYAKFRDQYVCCDFGKKAWYRWAGHIWKETDNGVDLQIKLSREVAGIFFENMTLLQNDMKNRGLIQCTGEGKGTCGECDHCQEEKKRSGLNAIYTKLKTVKFKESLMKDCREFFFDEEFVKKLDANKDLIAFNNGVLDLVTFKFRDGKSDDYISFSTGIDYDPERKYDKYDEWLNVEAFIKQVLPDPEVRDYFVKHLATNLFGGNTAQKFHIMTGNGSNGKSMIMNLASTALGDYACTVPIALFTQKRAGSGAAAPEVIRLKGRRLVSMQEPDEAVALNSGLMKLVSSGEKMFARDLFKSGTEFEVQAKFHLACNDKPKINTTDGGTWRRLVVINFTSKFVPKPSEPNEFPMDESIQYSVVSKSWATPFLTYLVHVLKEGNGLRKLSAPSKVLEYTSEYRNDNDGIAKFMSDKLVKLAEDEEPAYVDKTALKRAFKLWMTDNDLRLSPSDMEKRVEAQYGKYPKKGWTNFRLEN